MTYYILSGLCSVDPFTVRTLMTSLFKITTSLCHISLTCPSKSTLQSSPAFLPGDQPVWMYGLHHQVPLPCGFPLGLANRNPWQKIRGKEEVEPFISPALFCGHASGWLGQLGSFTESQSYYQGGSLYKTFFFQVLFEPRGDSIPQVIHQEH